MEKIGDYEKIMSDRNIFNQIVYTPLSEALRLIEERKKDKVLIDKVKDLLNNDIPNCFESNLPCAVLGRHIATPNQESRMFIAIAKENNLHPVFFEYYDDKFTSNNKFKHSLGQLHIARNKDTLDAEENIERITIVDFNKHNGKKISEVKTIWGESLVEFHQKLFSAHGYNVDDFHVFNASEWFSKNGKVAINYYANLLLLFTCHGILFENFLTSNDDEGGFTKNIVLPAIEKVINMVGVKPIIVPLEPLDLETDSLWFHHSHKIRTLIPKQI